MSSSAFAGKCSELQNEYNSAVDSLNEHYASTDEHIDTYNIEISKPKPSKFKARLALGKAILAYKRIYQSTGTGTQYGDVKQVLNSIKAYCKISKSKIRDFEKDHKRQARVAQQEIRELQSIKDNISY